MWTCPKCGRTFKRQEQEHYCGKAPETVEEYIAAQPEEVPWILGFTGRGAHKCLKQAIPRHVYEIFDCDEDLYGNPYKSSCGQFYLVTFPRIQEVRQYLKEVRDALRAALPETEAVWEA